MTDLLEQAFARVRTFSPEVQDDFARILLRLAGESEGTVYRLTEDEEASLAQSIAEAERGEFATDAEVRAVWAKYGH